MLPIINLPLPFSFYYSLNEVLFLDPTTATKIHTRHLTVVFYL
jgi:hypothetical protein